MLESFFLFSGKLFGSFSSKYFRDPSEVNSLTNGDKELHPRIVPRFYIKGLEKHNLEIVV